METLDDIPLEHLIETLKGSAWFSGNRKDFKTQGYSFDVMEETCLRDVLYRDEPLFDTLEEALIAHWKRHYTPTHT